MQNQEMTQCSNKVLIVGGGMGGIRAALDLAEAGRDVLLVDKAVSVGGFMTKLDRTFPTNNCDLCTLSPRLSASARENRIEVLPMSSVENVEGEPGNFTVTLTTRPRYIDMDKCTACGECLEKHPEAVRFTPGLDLSAPTCMRYPQSTPQAYSIDRENCTDMEGLAGVCKAGAIAAGDTEKVSEMRVGAVILAAGAEMFDISVLDNFGGGTFPNVVTGLEYERIMSASGPTQGSLLRPSDGKQPKRVAWIQCVGSRGIGRHDVSYCSGVCCMYALKEAVVTKERFHDEIDATIFYMDMRTSGKDYEKYRNRAENDYGVKFVRSRPHTITQDGETGDLSLSYSLSEAPELTTENFDMVVLSTGFRVSGEMKALGERLGIELNAHDFAKTSDFSPVATSRPGIYVCGLYESPKDIPETMAQASAAACRAASDLAPVENGASPVDELPMERDVAGHKPRIGVFICDCGFNIGSAIDVSKVAEEAKGLNGVVVSRVMGHGCSAEAIKEIQEAIKTHELNRIVVGGCSPRTHQAKFQDVIRAAGLNRYLVEMANIRDQNAWVHMGNREIATAKAGEQIAMAVSRVALSRPLVDHTISVNKDILVLGGGVAGMNAALSLADQGYGVCLVEQTPRLGGLAAKIRKTLSGEDVPTYLEKLIDRTLEHDRIEVLTGTSVVDHMGSPGMFTTGVQVAPRMYYRKIKHGVTIVATGAKENRPGAFLLGENDAVMSQIDLGALVQDREEEVKAWENIVMIQCVGSRNDENPNCARTCCQSAVKNALAILDVNPDARIFILNRDIRTPGFQEDYYLKARERGVIFVRYEAENPPVVTKAEKGVSVTFHEPILGRDMEISADCLALSTGLIADDESTEDLARIFHLSRNDDGYFLEDHVKLRPVDLTTSGFLVAGSAHGPKGIKESIAQAHAAAGRALTFLNRDTINLGAGSAIVESEKCAGCLVCVRACPYGIPVISPEGYSVIDPALCQGCGKCAAECPAKAIQLMQYEDDAISAELTGLLERIEL